MDINIKLKVKPFKVPNYILVEQKPGLKQDGFNEAPKFHLRDVDAETLHMLCETFKQEVFKKAGKQQPPQSCCCGD